jgi:hypothetical protein
MNERRGHSAGSYGYGGYGSAFAGSNIMSGNLDSMFRLSGGGFISSIPPVVLWNDPNPYAGSYYPNSYGSLSAQYGNAYASPYASYPSQYGGNANSYGSTSSYGSYPNNYAYGYGNNYAYGYGNNYQNSYPNNYANSVYSGASIPSWGSNAWANPQAAPFIPCNYNSLPGSSNSNYNASAAQTVAYNQSNSSPNPNGFLNINGYSNSYSNPGQTTNKNMDSKPISVDGYVNKLEERLLHLHDIDAIGTMDMDYFTEQMAGIKKNYAAMLSVDGHLSSREQKQLNSQLSSLEKELNSRTTSSVGK